MLFNLPDLKLFSGDTCFSEAIFLNAGNDKGTNLFVYTLIDVESRDQFHQHILCSFCASRSRKRKKIDNLTVFFALLGSPRATVALKTLMKLTLVRSNVMALFRYELYFSQ